MGTSLTLQLSEHVYALPVEADLMMGRGLLYLTLITDGVRGATLVDTGTPGLLPAITAALGELGLSPADVRRVVVTHHDLDHIGSLEAVVAASGAEVLTSAAEVPYVQEGRRAQKMPPPERVDELMPHLPPHVRERLKNPPKVQVPVRRALEDGELLDIAGGVRVIFTPGHTVGHLSLYVEGDGVLISGDALTSAEGQLMGPPAQATADMPTAMASVTKLAALEPASILTYHGGWESENAAAQLRRIAAGGATS